MWSKTLVIAARVAAKVKRAFAMSASIGDRIQKLLDVEASNSAVAIDLMEALDPAMVELFEETATMFRAIIERVAKSSAEAEEDAKLQAIAKKLGLTNEQLITRLQTDPRSQPEDAQLAWARLAAFRAIKMLILACQRYWVWAATDLVRLRLSSATGYLRLEAEAVALVKLFMDEPAFGEQWFNISDPKAGRRFFNDTQSKVRPVLKSLELDGTYEIASGGSQHVRLAGMVRSFSSAGGVLKLSDQDVDPDNPFNFHLTVAHFHKIQGRVVMALAKVIPGLVDANWPKLFNAFATRINALWKTLEEHYADEIAASGPEPV